MSETTTEELVDASLRYLREYMATAIAFARAVNNPEAEAHFLINQIPPDVLDGLNDR